ncbi:MAG TPA: DUF1385 domain-containing protein [Thermodesulfobacteriota bacterium]|nr:DUF1385 domain-containing protein [Thermodesulfobacteriota bacterium]
MVLFQQPTLPVGGQAVIEGVMMKAPKSLAVVVRRPNGELVSKEEPLHPWSDRFPILKWPVLRGSLILMETMIQGIQALNFSANQAMVEERDGKEIGWLAMTGTLAVALLMGLGLFVALPHWISAYLGGLSAFNFGVDSFSFHLLDGWIKVFFFIAYIWIISRFKEIRRVFQYHGAEHKSIFTYEAGQDLTVENAKAHSTLHPRCGTSFILLVLVISILFFSLIFPWLPKVPSLGTLARNTLYIFIKILLMIPITGLAYEAIKYSGKKAEKPWVKILIMPGLWIQKLTTQEPSEDQIEVALQALRRVLELEGRPPEQNRHATTVV